MCNSCQHTRSQILITLLHRKLRTSSNHSQGRYKLSLNEILKFMESTLSHLIGHFWSRAPEGAMIRDGDHWCPISSIGAVRMISDNFSIFRTNCAIACGARAHMLRECWYSAGEMVRNPRNVWCFWPTAQYVNLLEFCFSIFVVSYFSLSEVRNVLNLGMPRSISLSKLFFYKSFTLLHSKFHRCWRLTALPLHSKKLVGYIWI